MRPKNTDREGPAIQRDGYMGCRGCKHYGIHDFHYEYCAAQPVEGQKYPWPGAGRHMNTPMRGCPHNDEGR